MSRVPIERPELTKRQAGRSTAQARLVGSPCTAGDHFSVALRHDGRSALATQAIPQVVSSKQVAMARDRARRRRAGRQALHRQAGIRSWEGLH